MTEHRPPPADPPTERIPRVRPLMPPPVPGEPPPVIHRPAGYRPPPRLPPPPRYPPLPPPPRYPPPPPRRPGPATGDHPGRPFPAPPAPPVYPPQPPRHRQAPPQRRQPLPQRDPLKATRVMLPVPPAEPARPAPRATPRRRRVDATPRHRVRRAGALARRVVVILSTLALIVAATGLGIAVWVEASLRRIAVFADYDGRPAAGAGTNWLLVGSDSRGDLTEQQQAELSTGGDLGSGRTDTILLVHIPGLLSTGTPTMVSIPRDSYVDIPGYGKDKINAAFAQGGAPLLAQTVEEATGLRLDHYTEIGFGGFGVVVDALGGVTMCPADPIDDPLAGINLPAGCQVLNGPNALGYVRTRATPRADLDRMLHQREFMSALLARASSPAIWLNPWRWYAVPHAAISSVAVDAGAHVWNLARLGWALHGLTTTVTVPIGEFTGNEAGSVLIWDSSAAGALFDALRSDAPVPQQVIDAQP